MGHPSGSSVLPVKSVKVLVVFVLCLGITLALFDWDSQSVASQLRARAFVLGYDLNSARIPWKWFVRLLGTVHD